METSESIGPALLVLDAVLLVGAMWLVWQQGTGDDATLTRGAAAIATVGLGLAVVIVLYGLSR